MSFDQGLGDSRQGFDGVLRAISADIRWNREQRDTQQDGQAGTLEIIALYEQGKDKEPAADNRADDRKMIQQKVKMRQIHDDSAKDPRRIPADAVRLIYHHKFC